MANQPQRLGHLADGAQEAFTTTPVLKARRHAHAPVGLSRTIVIVGSSLVVVLLFIASQWLLGHSNPAHFSGGESAHNAAIFRVQSEAAVRQLSILGVVGAGRAVAVPMPFDGTVQAMKVQFGDRVRAGDVLLTLDSSEIEVRLREAQSGVLKAAMGLDALDHWETGPEVMRAKRTLEGSQASLAKLERQLTATKGLFDRGFVSRDEYDALVQQRDNQKLAIANAKQDFAAALARGSPQGREIAKLELENAKAKLVGLQQEFDGATIKAPASGIVLRPPLPAMTAQAASLVDVGSHVQGGKIALMIADMASLVVSGRIDELDINNIRIGQPVAITSDAFPGLSLSGRIISSSAEAEQDASTHAPAFNVRAAIYKLDDAARSAIRIGMSARMTIDLSKPSTTIVIPINSVDLRNGKATVKVIDMRTGITREQPVTLGATTPVGVEITSGLTTADVLQVPQGNDLNPSDRPK
jgi:HlyD family secretion protein